MPRPYGSGDSALRAFADGFEIQYTLIHIKSLKLVYHFKLVSYTALDHHMRLLT